MFGVLPDPNAQTVKHDTTIMATQAISPSNTASTPQKISSSTLYRQITELAAALRGNIYAHQDTENFCVQKVGNSRNMRRYKNKSMYKNACAAFGHFMSLTMMRRAFVFSGLTASAIWSTTKARAACAGGAIKRKKVGCGRSDPLSRAGERCWKLVMKTSNQNRQPTESMANACSTRCADAPILASRKKPIVCMKTSG